MQLIGSESPYKYVLRFHLLYLIIQSRKEFNRSVIFPFSKFIIVYKYISPFFIYLLRFYFFLIVNTIQMCDIECIITIDVSQCFKIRYT